MLVLFLPLLVLVSFSSLSRAFTTRSWSDSLVLATELVANLTLSEKVGVVTGVGQFSSRCIGNTYAINRSLPNAPSGFPSICMNDGPAGMRAVDNVTGFPTGINVASTFSRRLMQARGQAIAEEFRAKGANIFLGPAMDLMRNPKAGRGWEGFGADPWLSGEAAYSTIVGVQSIGVQACAKHFIAYVQEHYRYTYNAALDDRTTHELYLWPFIRSIEANVSSVMCAYPQTNGTYNCGNSELLNNTGLLYQNGFEGYVISDWGATHETTTQYANGGLDMEQPGDWILIGGGIFGSSLKDAVEDGSVSESRINTMVEHIVASWFRLGQDQNYPPPNYNVQETGGLQNLNINVRTPEHTALVREIAGASSVLLKNVNGALPLTGAEKSIAVVGLDLLVPEEGCDLNGCDNGTVVAGWGSGTILLDYVVPPLTAIQSYLAANSTTTLTSSPSQDTGEAAKAAKGKDVAIVFINAMSGELGALQDVNGNFGDRNDMLPWYSGAELVESVAAVNNNTIVVIHSTGPILMPWSDSTNITAIIYAGAPGEQTGPAIVDVLYGSVNPSGRLPFTIAEAESDYPTDILYFSIDIEPTINFTETLFIDYRHFDAADITPLYPFGFGLSYTSFTYSDLSASMSGVTFTVTNTGERDGTDIPQLYLGFPSDTGEPPKVLRGFEEVILAAGASSTVSLSLTERDVSIWDTVTQQWVIPMGTFAVYVGASSRDIRLTGGFSVPAPGALIEQRAEL